MSEMQKEEEIWTEQESIGKSSASRKFNGKKWSARFFKRHTIDTFRNRKPDGLIRR